MDAFNEGSLISTAPACKHTGGLQLLSSGHELVPALGLAWANCINTRIFLSKTEYAVSTSCLKHTQYSRLPQPATLPLRCMQVVFSPCLPQDSCFYVVNHHGLEGIDPSQLESGDLQHYHQEITNEQPCQSEQGGMLQDAADSKPSDAAVLQNNTHAVTTSSLASPSSFKKRQTCTMATGVFASF